MLEPTQTETDSPASRRPLSPRPASNYSSLVTHHCPIQSLAKHNRRPSQIVENNHQRSKSIASFSRVFRVYSSARSAFSRHPALTRVSAPVSSRSSRRSILPLSNRQSARLKPSVICRKHSTTLRSNRQKMQGSQQSHDNMELRLLLLDTPSGTVCTGFDQGCKDRARKPFFWQLSNDEKHS